MPRRGSAPCAASSASRDCRVVRARARGDAARDVRGDRASRSRRGRRFHAPDVSLGMRRLSVMDPAMGQQPMGNEDGTHPARVQRRDLQPPPAPARAAWRAATRSRRRATPKSSSISTRRWATTSSHALRGMFAFALWDTRRRPAAASRAIASASSRCTTGSRTAGSRSRRSCARCWRCPDFPPTRRASDAVAQYLTFGYVPETHCIFEGVRKLPPGHRLTWEPRR